MEYWWAPRAEGEPTRAFLGRVLDELGAVLLAEKARAGHYDQYDCPPEFDDGRPMRRLEHDLSVWVSALTWTRGGRAVAQAMARAVAHAATTSGEFLATTAERDVWRATTRVQLPKAHYYAECTDPDGGLRMLIVAEGVRETSTLPESIQLPCIGCTQVHTLERVTDDQAQELMRDDNPDDELESVNAAG